MDFAAADFGAGIDFTPVGSLSLTLPPHSLDRYCLPWTPASTGTPHRCILVTLKQAGFQDMHSQRNVDLAAGAPGRYRRRWISPSRCTTRTCSNTPWGSP